MNYILLVNPVVCLVIINCIVNTNDCKGMIFIAYLMKCQQLLGFSCKWVQLKICRSLESQRAVHVYVPTKCIVRLENCLTIAGRVRHSYKHAHGHTHTYVD